MNAELLVPASILAAAFIAALAGTYGLRRYALATKLLDVPNARSSHTQAVPRGGGLAFVLAFGGGLLALALSGRLAWPLFTGVTGGGALIAAAGFWDDHRPLSPRLRLACHVGAAVWALAWLGGGLTVDLGIVRVHTVWLVYPLALVAIVWIVNLYNFMDGIDGIAATEAIFAALGAALLLLATGRGSALLWPQALLAASVAGFSLLNWPPAKIFMGDVGSGFLGYVLAVFVLLGVTQANLTPWAWLILLGVFVVDATVTVLWRYARGVKLSDAHRSHAYQILSRRYGSHRAVTLRAAAINVCWLLPLALAAARWPNFAPLIAVVAVTPLIVLALRVGAGRETE